MADARAQFRIASKGPMTALVTALQKNQIAKVVVWCGLRVVALRHVACRVGLCRNASIDTRGLSRVYDDSHRLRA